MPLVCVDFRKNNVLSQFCNWGKYTSDRPPTLTNVKHAYVSQATKVTANKTVSISSLWVWHINLFFICQSRWPTTGTFTLCCKKLDGVPAFVSNDVFFWRQTKEHLLCKSQLLLHISLNLYPYICTVMKKIYIGRAQISWQGKNTGFRSSSDYISNDKSITIPKYDTDAILCIYIAG